MSNAIKYPWMSGPQDPRSITLTSDEARELALALIDYSAMIIGRTIRSHYVLAKRIDQRSCRDTVKRLMFDNLSYGLAGLLMTRARVDGR